MRKLRPTGMKPFAKLTLIRNHKDSNPSLSVFKVSTFNCDAILWKGRECITGHWVDAYFCLPSMPSLGNSLPILLQRSNPSHSQSRHLKWSSGSSHYGLQRSRPDSGLAYQSPHPSGHLQLAQGPARDKLNELESTPGFLLKFLKKESCFYSWNC